MDKKEVIGVIFPILPLHVTRLFEEGKDIFVKFTKLTRIGTKSKIVFYVSGEKVLIGEGMIIDVERMEPKMVWMRYGERIFLNQEEYDEYVERSPISRKARKMEKITTFIIKDLKKYKKPIKSIYHVTPTGCYLTSEEYYRMKSSKV